MGDRVLFQVIGKPERPTMGSKRKVRQISPVAYGHWCGSRTPQILASLKTRMASRGADVPYTFARLIQEMVGDDAGNLSFGAWNQTRMLNESDSHGDAGVVLIRFDKGEGMTFECLGGYLTLSEDGYVISPHED